MNHVFYFLLALTAVLAATTNAGGPVLDIHGDIIFDSSYYVLPFFLSVAGGGLTLAPRSGTQCPLYIGLERLRLDRGIPVRFSSWKSKVGFVLESEKLNIEMEINATTCVQSTYWYVSEPDRHIRKRVIAAGPKPNFFQIMKAAENHSVYKIAYCPDDNPCIDVGAFKDLNGNWRLALNSRPLLVVLMKATEAETSPKTMSII